jgi:hypothetical protein
MMDVIAHNAHFNTVVSHKPVIAATAKSRQRQRGGKNLQIHEYSFLINVRRIIQLLSALHKNKGRGENPPRPFVHLSRFTYAISASFLRRK